MKKRSGHFIAGHFFGFTSEGVRICIYTGFFLIVSSPQNHLVYQFSHRLRVSVINDQLTPGMHTPSFGVITAHFTWTEYLRIAGPAGRVEYGTFLPCRAPVGR
jgi:hypothetical protein